MSSKFIWWYLACHGNLFKDCFLYRTCGVWRWIQVCLTCQQLSLPWVVYLGLIAGAHIWGIVSDYLPLISFIFFPHVCCWLNIKLIYGTHLRDCMWLSPFNHIYFFQVCCWLINMRVLFRFTGCCLYLVCWCFI